MQVPGPHEGEAGGAILPMSLCQLYVGREAACFCFGATRVPTGGPDPEAKERGS